MVTPQDCVNCSIVLNGGTPFPWKNCRFCRKRNRISLGVHPKACDLCGVAVPIDTLRANIADQKLCIRCYGLYGFYEYHREC